MDSQSILRSKILVNALSEINYRYSASLTHFGRANQDTHRALKFIGRVDLLLKSKIAHKLTFQRGILELPLSLEIIWMLSSSEIIDINNYYDKILTKNELTTLTHDIVSLGRHANASYVAHEICKNILGSVFNYCESKGNTILRDKLIKSVFNIVQSSENGDVIPPSIFNDLSNKRHVKTMLSDLLLMCLLDKGVDIISAFGDILRYTPKDSEYLKNVVTLVLTHFTMSELTKELGEIIATQENINWCAFSYLVCYLLIENKETLHDLQSVINTLMQKSLNDFSERHLYAALLVGKIMCLDCTGPIMTFLHWFTYTFSSESSRPLNTEPKAKFFLSSMTKVVDIEPACYLQVYSHKAPSVPSSCQRDLSEYLQMAKVQLLSMNKSTELGFFENTSCLSSAENDIKQLVKQLESNGKLTQAFIASTAFRRQYFEKTFLPELLQKSCTDDPSRHKLIHTLLSIGKVSNSALATHLAKCPVRN